MEKLNDAATRAQLEKYFRNAEGSAAHEFGDDYDPGETYLDVRRKVIAGEMTFEDAQVEVLAPYKKGSS
ncbi:hypothetical protein [Ottowia sp.]|uniref:hypothetical protein n=1 Tax=Ottowia sp. TaxID=1898956 RepID=UPI0025D768CF|nr:hypothetical protein [Ottowia sp.]MBK6612615.1 hypothetical protein [Ottowia sp.]